MLTNQEILQKVSLSNENFIKITAPVHNMNGSFLNAECKIQNAELYIKKVKDDYCAVQQS